MADELVIERPDILLIAGDIAKDGEEVSHIAVAKILTYLQDKKDIKVFVTPGNNDINNSTAKAYTKTGSFSVPNVTPERFTQIYSAFGYNNAIKKDNYSLSYVAQPYTGLWILSIDAAKYDADNRSGAIRQKTMEWIIDVLAEAKQNNTTVLAMMHHNIIEHFTDQNKITVNTVIDHWETASDSLIDAGLKVIFTGHNHAIDITTRTKGSNTLYDVETGSLITPPSSYRIMTLKNKELDIDTRHLTSIDVPLPNNEVFTAYSHRALSDLADEYFTMATKGGKFYLPVELRKDAIPLIRNAYMAHMAGDEKLSPLELAKIMDLYSANKEATQLIIGVMKTLWADLNTKDHKWHIKLTNP